MCIYRNDTSDGVGYRVNRPSRNLWLSDGCVYLWVLLFIGYFGNTGGQVSN